MYARLVANLDHTPQRLVESGFHTTDHLILSPLGNVGRVEIGEVVIFDSVIEGATGQIIEEPVGRLRPKTRASRGDRGNERP
jgi:hypothetical protein